MPLVLKNMGGFVLVFGFFHQTLFLYQKSFGTVDYPYCS